ncbi:hypothetical protein [Haloarchaeobius salinus]|uniref:hypothetical protein n=1 Tax=Haloarchaeobius salinus TaxID=1198298 RepID=UPI00210CB066|nr:hypothetical protein [Haloarchaeobius salinus]
MSSPEDREIPVLTPLADALERVVFADWYRWFVRGLLVAAGLVGAVHLVRATTDLLALSAGGAELLTVLTNVVVTLFVLAGALQLLMLARGVRRRELVVAESAAGVEESAEEVKTAAKELEETAADTGDEEVEREISDRVEQVEEQADEVKENVEGVKNELYGPKRAENDEDA